MRLAFTLLLAALVNGQKPVKHIGPVSGLVARDGTTFSSSRAGIWVETKDGRRKLDVPRLRVFDFAVCGELLLAVGGRPGQTGEVACIRTLDKQVAHWRAGSDVVYAVAIAPGGKRVTVGLANGRVFELDLPKLDAPRELKRHSAASRTIAYHGDRLVTGGLDGNLVLYGRDRKPRVIAAHTAGIDCVMFTTNGERVLSGARDGRVRIHSSKTGRLLRTYHRLGDRVNALCTDPSGDGWLAGLRNGKILRLLGTVATAEPVHGYEGPVHALCRDGARLLVGLRGSTASLRPKPSVEKPMQRDAGKPSRNFSWPGGGPGVGFCREPNSCARRWRWWRS